MKLDIDPQENLIHALQKIEGEFDYLIEMREHLNKHFYNLGF